MTRVKDLIVRMTARDNPSDVQVYNNVIHVFNEYERASKAGDNDVMLMCLNVYKGEGVKPELVVIDLCKYNVDIHTILEE